jgi:HAD superfamily hydrolase (TIGR01509 family)
VKAGNKTMPLFIFDMAGTLLNTHRLVLSVYQEYFKLYPSPVKPSIVPMQDMLTKSYEDIFKLLQIEPLQEHLSYLETIHEALLHKKLKTFPFAKTMLQQLKSKGIKLGLFTTELKRFALKELEHSGLYALFDSICTLNDVKQTKPHPEGLVTIIQQCQAPLHEVIYVGDSIVDLKAGQALGLTTYGVHQAHDQKMPFNQTFPNLKALKNFLLQRENHVL